MNPIKDALNKLTNPEKAKQLQRFFKTGRGEYGEGDIFLGITVPIQRTVAKQYQAVTLNDVLDLLKSKYHEHRLVALLILILKYKKTNETEKKHIVHLYLSNTKYINNWDLVDLSAPNILGEYFKDKDRLTLYKLAQSNNLWKKRIAIISCFTFIKNRDFEDALAIAKLLLHDTHDLIHKAVGWMLREVGKKNQQTEEEFLLTYYKTMPRTMLRYAIEKFDEKKRAYYLAK